MQLPTSATSSILTSSWPPHWHQHPSADLLTSKVHQLDPVRIPSIHQTSRQAELPDHSSQNPPVAQLISHSAATCAATCIIRLSTLYLSAVGASVPTSQVAASALLFQSNPRTPQSLLDQLYNFSLCLSISLLFPTSLVCDRLCGIRIPIARPTPITRDWEFKSRPTAKRKSAQMPDYENQSSDGAASNVRSFPCFTSILFFVALCPLCPWFAV